MNTSTLSKKFKTPAEKAAAVARNRANRAKRAGLNASKASKSNCHDRAKIQEEIDSISNH